MLKIRANHEYLTKSGMQVGPLAYDVAAALWCFPTLPFGGWTAEGVFTSSDLLIQNTEEWDLVEEIPVKTQATPVGTANTGVKFDEGKLRFELIAPEFLAGTASVLTYGAQKYGDRNWELGMEWSRPFGALMRHLWAWWNKEGVDSETGKSHLWHAACCLMFLLVYEVRASGKDDRASGAPGSLPK